MLVEISGFSRTLQTGGKGGEEANHEGLCYLYLLCWNNNRNSDHRGGDGDFTNEHGKHAMEC